MKKCRLAILICALLIVCAACGKTPSTAPASTEAPDSLVLTDGTLTDITSLYGYTQLRRLDIRGNDISKADYDALAAALPDCTILWSVPVGGTRWDSDSKKLTLTDFSEDDIPMLAYFPELTKVNATGCDQYAALCSAEETYPDVAFVWTVTVGERSYTNHSTKLDLTGGSMDAEAISEALSVLPSVTRVEVGDLPLTDEEKLDLCTEYPDVIFNWTVEVLPGVFAAGADETLDLRKHQVDDVDALAERLALLPGLKTVDLCDCGPSTEEMLHLRECLPDVKFVWRIEVSCWSIRTDLQGFSTGVRSRFPNGGGQYMGGGDDYKHYRNGAFDNLEYCTDLVALDIGHCVNISDVSFIARLPQLRYLVLAMLNLSEIDALSTQSHLEFVEIYENDITDLTPLLASKDTLKYLNCGMCPFTDIDVLCQLTHLERLWIAESALSDEQLAALAEALPNTTIMASRNRNDAAGAWRTGNWSYVEMQRIFGLRAQFQGNTTPSPEPSATPKP